MTSRYHSTPRRLTLTLSNGADGDANAESSTDPVSPPRGQRSRGKGRSKTRRRSGRPLHGQAARESDSDGEALEQPLNQMPPESMNRFIRESRLFLARTDAPSRLPASTDDGAHSAALVGKLRSLETSTGILRPSFHPDRQMYVLLVRPETTHVYFYTTAYGGAVTVNSNLSALAPVALVPGFNSQKVVLTVDSQARLDPQAQPQSKGGLREERWDQGRQEGVFYDPHIPAPTTAADASREGRFDTASLSSYDPASSSDEESAGNQRNGGIIEKAAEHDVLGLASKLQPLMRYVVDIRRSAYAATEAARLQPIASREKAHGIHAGDEARPLPTPQGGRRKIKDSPTKKSKDSGEASVDGGQVEELSFADRGSGTYGVEQVAATDTQHHPTVYRQPAAGEIVWIRQSFDATNKSHLRVSKGQAVEAISCDGRWLYCVAARDVSGKPLRNPLRGWLPLSHTNHQLAHLQANSHTANSQQLGPLRDRPKATPPSFLSLGKRTSTVGIAQVQHERNGTYAYNQPARQHPVKPFQQRLCCLLVTLRLPYLGQRRPWVCAAYCITQLVMLIIALSLDAGIAPGRVNPLAGPNPSTILTVGGIYAPDVIRKGQVQRILTALVAPVGIVSTVLHCTMVAMVGFPLERTHGSIVALVAVLTGGIGGNLLSLAMLSRQLFAGGHPVLFGLIGTVVAHMIVFRHRARAVLHDAAVLLALAVVCVGFGLLPFLNNWQACGGFVFGLFFGITAVSFASRAHPDRLATEVRERHDKAEALSASRANDAGRLNTEARAAPSLRMTVVEGSIAYAADCDPSFTLRHSRRKSLDIAYGTLFGGWVSFLVLVLVTFLFVPSSTPSCLWCLRATCIDAYDWCIADALPLIDD